MLALTKVRFGWVYTSRASTEFSPAFLADESPERLLSPFPGTVVTSSALPSAASSEHLLRKQDEPGRSGIAIALDVVALAGIDERRNLVRAGASVEHAI